jgi:hypothetical protein
MMETLQLQRPYGTELEYAVCFFCQTALPDNPRLRTSAQISLGRRNFCEQLNRPPEQRCLQEFRKRFR